MCRPRFFWIGSLLAQDAETRSAWLIALSIWPVLVWSKLGSRESRHQTKALVFSAGHSRLRSEAAAWLAGVLMTLLLFSGAMTNLAISGQTQALLGLTLGAALIPTAALTMGVWSRGSKLFEILYLLAWYIGAAKAVPALDYLGLTPDAVVIRSPLAVALVIAGLIILADVGRRRQMQIG